MKSTAEYAPMIKKWYPTSYVVAQKWYKHSTRTDTIKCYIHYTIAYWKSMSLVNLKNSLPWYNQSHPVPCLENDEVKVLWVIPWHLEKCLRSSAIKPDMSVLDKMTKKWYIIEGTV